MGSVQDQSSRPTSDAPKRNYFYDLFSRGEQEESPDVVTGMFHVLSIDVYALLDFSATLLFLTPLVYNKFDDLHDILIEPFSLTTRKVTPLWLRESLGVVLYLFSIELHAWIW